MLTDTGKTWAGTVTALQQPLLRRLQAWVAGNGWHGGGELELIEHWDGSSTLMEINPRFPGRIYGASLVHANLPAALVTGTGNARQGGGSFTRVVEEIAIHPDLGAPDFPWSASDYVSAATKHPSGIPEIARRRLVTSAAGPPHAPHLIDELALPPVPVSDVTPVLVVDAVVFTSRVRQFRNSIQHADVWVCHRIKTNPDPLLLRAALAAGMLTEAISRDEHRLAASLGAPPSRIVLNGPAKWWTAPTGDIAVRAVFVDSVPEFELIRELLDQGVGMRRLRSGCGWHAAGWPAGSASVWTTARSCRSLPTSCIRWSAGSALGSHWVV